jgi:hypothetical protein
MPPGRFGGVAALFALVGLGCVRTIALVEAPRPASAREHAGREAVPGAAGELERELATVERQLDSPAIGREHRAELWERRLELVVALGQSDARGPTPVGLGREVLLARAAAAVARARAARDDATVRRRRLSSEAERFGFRALLRAKDELKSPAGNDDGPITGAEALGEGGSEGYAEQGGFGGRKLDRDEAPRPAEEMSKRRAEPSEREGAYERRKHKRAHKPEYRPETTGALDSDGWGPDGRIGAASVRAVAPPAGVMQAVRAQLGSLQRCVPASMLEDMLYLRVRLRIDEAGAFRDPAVEGGELDPISVDCLEDRLATIRLPEPQGGSTVVAFDLMLGPKP